MDTEAIKKAQIGEITDMEKLWKRRGTTDISINKIPEMEKRKYQYNTWDKMLNLKSSCQKPSKESRTL